MSDTTNAPKERSSGRNGNIGSLPCLLQETNVFGDAEKFSLHLENER
jgi:hypothetical protein